MTAIIKKELKSYFTNMSGYIFLFFFVLLTAVFYFMNNVLAGNGDYYITIISTTILFLIMIPMITMRLFAEEQSQKTDQLLYTSPISVSSIVFGKFFAAVILLGIALLITGLFPLMLNPYGNLPISRILGTYLGYFLLGICFIAVGLFISVLTNSQITAAIGTFAAVFGFYVSDGFIANLPSGRISSVVFIVMLTLMIAYVLYDSTKNIKFSVIIFLLMCGVCGAVYYFSPVIYDGLIVKALKFVSLMSRFGSFSMGVISLSDLIYYFTFAFAFNYFTINVIEKRRWA